MKQEKTSEKSMHLTEEANTNDPRESFGHWLRNYTLSRVRKSERTIFVRVTHTLAGMS